MISEIIIAAIFVVNYGYVESGPNPLTIIGGNDTDIEAYKFLVSVQRKGTYCVGSVIGPTFVITVAHCVHGLNADDITVKVGSPSPAQGSSGLLIGILKPIYEHPYYNHETKVNDITLLRLRVKLYHGNNNGAIPLPVAAMTYSTGMLIKAIGFGESEIGVYTNMLKEANLMIKLDARCEGPYRIILGSQICAENRDVFLNYRDEGSPVLYENELIGIVSMTDESFRSKLTVLVRVAGYLEFIQRTMNETAPQP